MQTFARLAWSRKSACGSATEALRMLASLPRAFRTARSFGCLARWVLPNNLTFSFGRNFSLRQPVPLAGSETLKAE